LIERPAYKLLLPAKLWTNGEPNVRVVLKGIHRVESRLANGTKRTYFYAWRNGPRIYAEPGTAAFISEYHEAHASVRKPKAGTLMSLIAEYKASAEFRRLAPSTVRSYASYIKIIEEAFGDLPLVALEDRRIRGDFKSWRDKFANTPRKADYAWTTLSRIFRSVKIAVLSHRILVRVAVDFTLLIALTKYGRTKMWLLFWRMHLENLRLQ
jgi:hypothetical protein